MIGLYGIIQLHQIQAGIGPNTTRRRNNAFSSDGCLKLTQVRSSFPSQTPRHSIPRATYQNQSDDRHSSPTPTTFKLRRAQLSDVDAIARICASSFQTSKSRPLDQWSKQLSSALVGKSLAQQEHNQTRTRTSTPSSTTTSTSPRHATNIRRRRSFFCLVAQDLSTQAVIGVLAITLARPEAMLPPPFPTNASLRYYISNMAVAEEYRRRGVAMALLTLAQRVVKALPGGTTLWLHVDNDIARNLYTKSGFTRVEWAGEGMRRAVGWHGDTELMAKKLWTKRKTRSGTDSTDRTVSGMNNTEGVFVWEQNNKT